MRNENDYVIMTKIMTKRIAVYAVRKHGGIINDK